MTFLVIKKTFKLIPTEKDSSQRVVLRVGSQPQTITATYIEKSGNVSHFLFPENVKEIDLTAYGWDTIVRSDRMFKVRGSEQKQQGKHYFTHTQLFKLY